MDTGERMYLEEGNAQLSLEHLHRYSLASEYCKGKRVLDAACGSGYGSEMLSRTASKTIGIDINKDVIDANQLQLGNDKLCFKCASIDHLPFEDNSFDVVVSFETFEHVQAEIQDRFLKEIKRVLTPTGLLIISTPDKKFYTDYTGVKNPFHLKELYRAEFEEKLSGSFKNLVVKRQQVYPISLIYGDERRFSAYKYDYSKKDCTSAESNLDEMRFDYLICLCSDSAMPTIDSSFCIDEQMSVFGAFRGDGAQNAANVYLPQIKSLELQATELNNSNQALAADRDRVVSERNAIAEDRDRVASDRDAIAADRDRVVSERNAIAEDRDRVASDRDAIAADRDRVVSERNAIAEDRDRVVSERNATAADRDRILNSTCWRMTAPIRFMLDNAKKATKRLKRPLRGTIKNFVPYGIMVRWLEFRYGKIIDKPLFYYPGFFKRAKRLIKFCLPYFVAMRFRKEYCGSTNPVIKPFHGISDGGARKKLVLVVHEAQKTGAPFLAKALARSFMDFGYQVKVVLLDGGPLVQDFINMTDVEFLFPATRSVKHEQDLVEKLYSEGYRDVYLNTTVSGSLAKVFKQHGFNTMTLVHEMDYILKVLSLQKVAREIAEYSDKVIVPSLVVSDSWKRENVVIPAEKIVVMPQHNYHVVRFSKSEHADIRARVRKELKVSDDEVVVLCVGLVEIRKGILHFLDLAEELTAKNVKVRLVWVGTVSSEVASNASIMKRMESSSNCCFIGFKSNINEYYCAADMFLCASESDAFPTVILEAASHGLPSLLAKGHSGTCDLFEQAPAGLVDKLSGKAFAHEIIRMVADKELYRKAVAYANKIAEKFSRFYPYAAALLELHSARKVSCVIPNYNYSGFLKKRIETVLAQKYAVDELLILDDNSSDDSDNIIKEMLPELQERFVNGVKYIRNTENQGVFRQWQRGFHESSGDVVWIAEADDLCTPDFISRLIGFFDDGKVVLAYSQSNVIDENGTCHAANYCYYTDDLSTTKFRNDYVNPGIRELADGLAVRNTIPNASAVLMRRDVALTLPFDRLCEFKAAGDWLVYINMAMRGRIAFSAHVMNSHRRHSQSVIARIPERTLEEIKQIYKFIDHNCRLPSSTIARMRDELVKLDSSCQFDRLCPQLTSAGNGEGLRVMVAISEFHYGGGEVFPIKLANKLNAKGCSVCILSVDRGPRNVDIVEMVDSDIGIVSLPEIEAQGGLAKFIQENHIRCVSSHIWWSDKAVFGAVCNLPEVVWMFSMHGCYENILHNPGIDPDFTSLVPQMFKRANAVVYTANKNLEIVRSLKDSYDGKLVKLNNGCDIPETVPVSRDDYGVGEKDVLLCFAARGNKDKGWEEVIKAIKRLNAEDSSRRYHAFMIGDSEYVNSLKKATTEPYVHFCGFQKNLSKFIMAADVFVLPTYFVSESQPMVIIEALSRGKPVIASDMGEIPEMIMANGISAGVILKSSGHPVSVGDFCDAVCNVCNPENYESFCQNAKKLFQRYDIDVCANNYLELLTQEGNK